MYYVNAIATSPIHVNHVNSASRRYASALRADPPDLFAGSGPAIFYIDEKEGPGVGAEATEPPIGASGAPGTNVWESRRRGPLG